MAEPIRWVNQSQPQTLYIVTLLLYLDAALGLIFGSVYFVFGVAAGILCLAAAAAAGWGIANERQWGYLLGLVVSSLGAFFLIVILLWDGLGQLFDIQFLILALPIVAQLLLLLHPQSREYQRIWFK
jgi:hypothetical protein